MKGLKAFLGVIKSFFQMKSWTVKDPESQWPDFPVSVLKPFLGILGIREPEHAGQVQMLVPDVQRILWQYSPGAHAASHLHTWLLFGPLPIPRRFFHILSLLQNATYLSGPAPRPGMYQASARDFLPSQTSTERFGLVGTGETHCPEPVTVHFLFHVAISPMGPGLRFPQNLLSIENCLVL